MAMAVRPGPMATGPPGLVRPDSEPSPRRPLAPKPQQRTEPSSRIAQVWPAPPATARAARPPGRATAPADAGDSLSPTLAVPPLPSWPLAPKPQQRIEPSSRIAQVWKSPAAIARAVRPGPRSTGATGAGTSSSPTDCVLPYPSRPSLPLPQHLTEPSSRMAQVCDVPAVMATAPRPRFTGGADAGRLTLAVDP